MWQLDAATAATVALQKAQATQIYAGLNLWPAATTARLVEAQLAEDGTYPNAVAVFGEGGGNTAAVPTLDFDPDQPRDPDGRWTSEEGAGSAPPAIVPVALKAGGGPEVGSTIPSKISSPRPSGLILAQEVDPDEESRRSGEPGEPQPGDALRVQRFNTALKALRAVDPANQNLNSLEPPGYVPTEADIARVEAATEKAKIATGATDPSLGPLSNAFQKPELSQHLDMPESFRKAFYPEIQPGPPGVVIQVSGRTAAQRGLSYQAGIVDRFGLTSPDAKWEAAGLKPDGLDGGQVGEAKYTDGFASSIYNPDLDLPFEHDEVERTKQQALKYSRFAPDETLTYYVNDQDFAEYLVRTFRSVSISNFRVIIVPATRG